MYVTKGVNVWAICTFGVVFCTVHIAQTTFCESFIVCKIKRYIFVLHCIYQNTHANVNWFCSNWFNWACRILKPSANLPWPLLYWNIVSIYVQSYMLEMINFFSFFVCAQTYPVHCPARFMVLRGLILTSCQSRKCELAFRSLLQTCASFYVPAKLELLSILY